MGKFIFFGLYSVLIYAGQIVLHVGAIFIPKWRVMLTGRKQSTKKIKEFSRIARNPIWIHCASLGEFEQGRPLLEKIKQTQPNQQLVLSFFSPSGYEIMKEYPFADLVIYLPADTMRNAKRLVRLINPSTLIMVKYELWWNLIATCQHYHVKTYIISAVFRSTDYFFLPLTNYLGQILTHLNGIFVQDRESQQVLIDKGIHHSLVVGDTRVDRVIQRAASLNTPSNLDTFLRGKKIIVYGSIWIEDMHIIRDTIEHLESFVHVVVPHDISHPNISQIQDRIKLPTFKYSDGISSGKGILIIDKIGLLSGLYHYAKYAYIGGGFQRGIHNILEPGAYRIPVFFGPNHQKFVEATTLVKLGLNYAIHESQDMITRILDLENNEKQYSILQEGIDLYLSTSKGATDLIYNSLFLQSK